MPLIHLLSALQIHDAMVWALREFSGLPQQKSLVWQEYLIVQGLDIL